MSVIYMFKEAKDFFKELEESGYSYKVFKYRDGQPFGSFIVSTSYGCFYRFDEVHGGFYGLHYEVDMADAMPSVWQDLIDEYKKQNKNKI